MKDPLETPEVPLTINYGNKQFGTVKLDLPQEVIKKLATDHIIVPALKISLDDGYIEITEFSIIPYDKYDPSSPDGFSITE